MIPMANSEREEEMEIGASEVGWWKQSMEFLATER